MRLWMYLKLMAFVCNRLRKRHDMRINGRSVTTFAHRDYILAMNSDDAITFFTGRGNYHITFHKKGAQ